MAYRSSNLFLLYAESLTTASTFIKVGATRDLTWTLSNGVTDVTNKDSSGNIEQLEGKAGLQVTISANGVYDDAGTTMEELRTTALNGSFREYVCVLPDTSTTYLRCEGKITNLEFNAGTNAEIAYSIAISGTGGATISTGGVTLA